MSEIKVEIEREEVVPKDVGDVRLLRMNEIDEGAD